MHSSGNEQTEWPKQPFSVMVKPVGSRCNMDCGYCYYLKTEYPGDNAIHCMTDETLERFIRQFIEASPGPEVSFVWHGGEPTLAGLDFYRRAAELQRRALPEGWTCWNSLQTNGVLLDDEWCAFLAEARFDVGLSMDGPERLHDHYRKDLSGRGTYRAAADAARRLRAHGIQPDLLCTVNARTAEEPLEAYRALREFNTGWIQFIPIVQRVPNPQDLPEGADASFTFAPDNGRLAQDGGASFNTASDGDKTPPERAAALSSDSVTPEAYGDFLCAVFDEWAFNDLGRLDVQMFAETARVWAGGEAGLCWMAPACGRALVVEADGGVYSCDHYVNAGRRLGSIYSSGLGELANSHKQREFGENKRAGLPGQCLSCEWLNACNGGCPKDRFALADNGESGLNCLCGGLRRFFAHAYPVMSEIISFTRRGESPKAIMSALRAREAAKWKGVGRNDPCPCGSGKKAKFCCWERRPGK